MRETRIIMGMPVTLDVRDATSENIERVFTYFREVDEQFSPFKEKSEVSRMNRGLVSEAEQSVQMREVLGLAEQTKKETDGYFDIQTPAGTIDPSGIVKGWAIRNAAQLLHDMGYENFYVDAGGDIQTSGTNRNGEAWRIGIRNPFNPEEIVKVVYPHGHGVATSGIYERGNHIYNPHAPEKGIKHTVSLTVIGPDILEADRFATAAFAMGASGIEFIERLPECEGYLISSDGRATMTSGFAKFTNTTT